MVEATDEHIGQVFRGIDPDSASEVTAAGFATGDVERMLLDRVNSGAETWAVVGNDDRCHMVGFPALEGTGIHINTVAAASFREQSRGVTIALARKMRQLQKRWPDAAICCACRIVKSEVFEWYGALGFKPYIQGVGYVVFRRPSLQEAR